MFEEIYSYFGEVHPEPFYYQRRVWKKYRTDHGLIHSATGTGKTMAIWLGILRDWAWRHRYVMSPRRIAPVPLRVLWITPLRSLANDIQLSLLEPIANLSIPWTVECRTGDTSAYRKTKQLKRLPTALITTPESLSLMLTRESLIDQLKGLEAVVVDEWHELMGTKRGMLLELSLARLRNLSPSLRIWGLSATIDNLKKAAARLTGVYPQREVSIIKGIAAKKLTIQAILPDRVDRFPWAGHLGTTLVAKVAKELDPVRTALVFTNTRSQAEVWYQHLLQARPEWAGQMGLHHGSLDPKIRAWVEHRLSEGALKVVVCTSSLDLGVDFPTVDLVVQVGSPKSTARLLQRAGRSGHKPDQLSKLLFVPTHALELIELGAARKSIAENRIEDRVAYDKPLDVLTQHVVTRAMGGGFDGQQLFKEVRSTVAYHTLSREEWDWVLDFVTRGGNTLQAYPEFKKVVYVDGRYVVENRRVGMLHRRNIGTIESDAAMTIKFLKGTRLGTVEESFLSKMMPGDRFLFAGRLLEFVTSRDDTAYVRRAKGTADKIPRWLGGRLPWSSELSSSLRSLISIVSKNNLFGKEMKRLRDLFAIQGRWSAIPTENQLLIESFKLRSDHFLFLYPLEGRSVHEGLAAIIAHRTSKTKTITLSYAYNDFGIVFKSSQPFDWDETTWKNLLSPDQLTSSIEQSLNVTEMAKRQFRQIARIAGLVQSGLGVSKSLRQIQASSNLFFEVFEQYDPENLLLKQSRREVFERQLDQARLAATLERLNKSEIVYKTLSRLTPFAFPLYVEKMRDRVSSESLLDRIQRMQQQLEAAAANEQIAID